MPPDSHPTGRAAAGALPFLLLIAAYLIFFIAGSARAATAQEMPGGTRVGDGEVSIGGGEVYAGKGCAKAGNIVAGDCEGEDEGTGAGSPAAGTPEQATPEENTSPDTTLTEETTGLENTGLEEEASACPAEPPEGDLEATVARAVDGDTVELTEVVEGTATVRLIGVDTPELEGESGDPEPYAEEAAAFTTGALAGQEVILQIGEEKTDDYGRLLAYAWTAPEDGFVDGLKQMLGMGGPEFVNRALIQEGFAQVLTIEPNDRYAGCLEEAEQAARDEGAGIWADDEATSGEQYASETGGESTVGERTVLEETVVEESAVEQTSPESTASASPDQDDSESSEPSVAPDQSASPEAPREASRQPAANETTTPVEDQDGGQLTTPTSGDPAAEDQYREEASPAIKESHSTPDYEKCDSPIFLDGFSGEDVMTRTVAVPHGSFLLASRTELVDQEKPAAFVLDVYRSGSESYLERVATVAQGTDRTYVDSGPGEFDLSASAHNFSYDGAVYGCGDEVAGREPVAQAPVEEQAMTPITKQSARQPGPEEEAVPETAYEPAQTEQGARFYQTVEPPLASLPTRQTTTGDTVTLLPETGGPSLLTLLLGGMCLAGGLLGLSMLGRGCRVGSRFDPRAEQR